ncbi:MAG: His-Xaa-Ser system radical SAM maturase HxsB [Elusimicrobiota bacterium]|jgi:His-Xaa-Ser system radical SAM maturase HxsB
MMPANTLYATAYKGNGHPYKLLPFRFVEMPNQEICLVNEVGEYSFITKGDLASLVSHAMPVESDIYKDLRSMHFVVDNVTQHLLPALVTKYRTKKSFIFGFTKLHMVVPTLRCNHSCQYCQVSRVGEGEKSYDMTRDTATKVVDVIMAGPAPSITIEFQGGEPLLNYPVVEYIVEYASNKAAGIGKSIDFVVATNLSVITDGQLEFFRKYKVNISTSLDGPEWLHNENRPIRGGNGYRNLINNLARVRSSLGIGRVSALLTITNKSLGFAREIVDEYLKCGFRNVFLRPLNPYGYALKARDKIGYHPAQFMEFYQKCLEYIISINLEGTFFSESYACMILTRILTPFPIGFVDLQSPAGAGIAGVIYNHNGNVYPADEARMLAEQGDDAFLMGNVNLNTYQQIFGGEVMRLLGTASCLEALPGCADCAFQPYCGADPINNYATQGNIFGQQPTSERCKIKFAMIQHLMGLLRSGGDRTQKVLWSWINERDEAPCSDEDKS